MEHEQPGNARSWRWAVIGFVLAAGAAGPIGFATGRFRTPPEQPIAFNHQKHVEENQIECSMCHEHYATETFSGLPSAEVCAACHQEAMGESAEEAKLVGLLSEGRPLLFQSAFQQPSHVFYSHRRHVVKAQIECERCHGDVARTTSPSRRAKPLTMQGCIDCHDQHNVPVDCNTCHR